VTRWEGIHLRKHHYVIIQRAISAITYQSQVNYEDSLWLKHCVITSHTTSIHNRIMRTKREAFDVGIWIPRCHIRLAMKEDLVLGCNNSKNRLRTFEKQRQARLESLGDCLANLGNKGSSGNGRDRGVVLRGGAWSSFSGQQEQRYGVHHEISRRHTSAKNVISDKVSVAGWIYADFTGQAIKHEHSPLLPIFLWS
jgi:hypothetical protein